MMVVRETTNLEGHSFPERQDKQLQRLSNGLCLPTRVACHDWVGHVLSDPVASCMMVQHKPSLRWPAS
jgi:hypothetical protein